jgi:hypothetical protein
MRILVIATNVAAAVAPSFPVRREQRNIVKRPAPVVFAMMSVLFAVTSLTAQQTNKFFALKKLETRQTQMIAHAESDIGSGNCIAPASCSATVNIPFDTAGVPDPIYWGNGGYLDVPFQFSNVPAGYRVRIMRLYGDHIAWAHNAGTPMPTNSHAGVLWGIWSTASHNPPFQYSANFCFVYHQGALSSSGDFNQYFDTDVSPGGLLAADNAFIVQLAIFLSDIGVSIHQELTTAVVYHFESTSTASQ